MKTGFFLAMTLLIFSGCKREGDEHVPGTAPATADMKHCQSDDECILVDISCNGCCDQDAVNRKDSSEYYEHRRLTCEGYSGPVCECCFVKRKAVCAGGRCESLILERSCGQPFDLPLASLAQPGQRGPHPQAWQSLIDVGLITWQAPAPDLPSRLRFKETHAARPVR